MQTEKILKFICEEVTRQGHNINVHGDGFTRVVGMLEAWDYGLQNMIRDIELPDLRYLAGLIEDCNQEHDPLDYSLWEGKFRTCQVTIGGRLCPHWKDVPRLLQELWDHKNEMTPDEVYVAFEKIHPFQDGNGRTGKILHNWILNTLDDPVLVKDYFGGGNP